MSDGVTLINSDDEYGYEFDPARFECLVPKIVIEFNDEEIAFSKDSLDTALNLFRAKQDYFEKREGEKDLRWIEVNAAPEESKNISTQEDEEEEEEEKFKQLLALQDILDKKPIVLSSFGRILERRFSEHLFALHGLPSSCTVDAMELKRSNPNSAVLTEIRGFCACGLRLDIMVTGKCKQLPNAPCTCPPYFHPCCFRCLKKSKETSWRENLNDFIETHSVNCRIKCPKCEGELCCFDFEYCDDMRHFYESLDSMMDLTPWMESPTETPQQGFDRDRILQLVREADIEVQKEIHEMTRSPKESKKNVRNFKCSICGGIDHYKSTCVGCTICGGSDHHRGICQGCAICGASGHHKEICQGKLPSETTDFSFKFRSHDSHLDSQLFQY